MRIITLPGAFAPRSDSHMLAAAVARHEGIAGAEVLELGTGSGLVAVAAARAGARAVTAVDVSRRALASAWINARLNGVRVRPRRGDLFAPVAGERFDLVASNPPYLPGDGIPRRGSARAWEGGAGGRELIDRICAGVVDHLRPGGTVLLVHSSVCDVQRTVAALDERGLRAEVIERRRGPLGPLLAERMADVAEEDICVVRGTRGA